MDAETKLEKWIESARSEREAEMEAARRKQQEAIEARYRARVAEFDHALRRALGDPLREILGGTIDLDGESFVLRFQFRGYTLALSYFTDQDNERIWQVRFNERSALNVPEKFHAQLQGFHSRLVLAIDALTCRDIHA